MTPLDLSTAPPRAPREELAGIIFLPRTIDKVRASLPGGNLGKYELPGLTEMLCTALGIDLAALRDVVAEAASDDDVASYVSALVTPEQVDAWNTMVSARQVQNGDRAKAIANYPYLADRPDVPLALDNLVEDDRRLFA